MIEVDTVRPMVTQHAVVPELGVPHHPSLAAVAYAAFFTEAEREEIGTFDELPVPERARWESVAAHIARTVVSPIDEDIDRWRAEQRADLARRVRDAPYTRDVWRATMRATDLQHGIKTLRELLDQSRASAATARSHSRRLAMTTEAMKAALWPDSIRGPSRAQREQRPYDISPTNLTPTDISGSTDRPADPHELMVRSA